MPFIFVPDGIAVTYIKDKSDTQSKQKSARSDGSPYLLYCKMIKSEGRYMFHSDPNNYKYSLYKSKEGNYIFLQKSLFIASKSKLT